MDKKDELWGIVELMGHGLTAGRLSRPADWGGLLRVDVPDGDSYRTEYYGAAAIYSIKITSEEIARAGAPKTREIRGYNVPIIPLEEHQRIVDDLRGRIYRLSAPAPEQEDEDEDKGGPKGDTF